MESSVEYAATKSMMASVFGRDDGPSDSVYTTAGGFPFSEGVLRISEFSPTTEDVTY
jgi:hypothetical protein